jgi:hypothetical protein
LRMVSSLISHPKWFQLGGNYGTRIPWVFQRAYVFYHGSERDTSSLKVGTYPAHRWCPRLCAPNLLFSAKFTERVRALIHYPKQRKWGKELRELSLHIWRASHPVLPQRSGPTRTTFVLGLRVETLPFALDRLRLIRLVPLHPHAEQANVTVGTRAEEKSTDAPSRHRGCNITVYICSRVILGHSTIGLLAVHEAG